MWPCFNKNNRQQKDFYMRCLNILRNCTSLIEFKNILTAVLTVAYSEHQDSGRNACAKYKELLLNLIKCGSANLPEFPADHLFADMINLDESEERSSNLKINSKSIRPLQRELANIKYVCSKNVAGPIPNKDFGERLGKLCNYFLLWTAIVPTLFYHKQIQDKTPILTASSAISEEYFKDIKCHVFGNSKNNSLDFFLKRI